MGAQGLEAESHTESYESCESYESQHSIHFAGEVLRFWCSWWCWFMLTCWHVDIFFRRVYISWSSVFILHHFLRLQLVSVLIGDQVCLLEPESWCHKMLVPTVTPHWFDASMHRGLSRLGTSNAARPLGQYLGHFSTLLICLFSPDTQVLCESGKAPLVCYWFVDSKAFMMYSMCPWCQILCQDSYVMVILICQGCAICAVLRCCSQVLMAPARVRFLNLTTWSVKEAVQDAARRQQGKHAENMLKTCWTHVGHMLDTCWNERTMQGL